MLLWCACEEKLHEGETSSKVICMQEHSIFHVHGNDVSRSLSLILIELPHRCCSQYYSFIADNMIQSLSDLFNSLNLIHSLIVLNNFPTAEMKTLFSSSRFYGFPSVTSMIVLVWAQGYYISFLESIKKKNKLKNRTRMPTVRWVSLNQSKIS